jgi:hypothetical protein
VINVTTLRSLRKGYPRATMEMVGEIAFKGFINHVVACPVKNFLYQSFLREWCNQDLNLKTDGL